MDATVTVGIERQASTSAFPMSRFWLVGWSFCVALAWLLPNHYPPWTTFHQDAWMACVMLAAALWLLLRLRAPVPWTGLPLLVAAFTALPLLQFAAGLVVQAGNAWISTAYLLGFLLAWLSGARWETAQRSQLGDGLFLAIGIGAVVSVGLALHQWLQLDRLDIWSMGGGAARPFANLGQPNQLGTLLVWGLLALGWAVVRQKVGARVAIFGACYLLFGLALTGSRTGWVAIALLVLASWAWRRHWPDPATPRAVTALGGFFVACVLSIGPLAALVQNTVPADVADIVRISTESRPVIWAMFLDASLDRPVWGYGWGQVAMAHIHAALDHPPLYIYFSHSHNLFLDLVLWCGWPLGLLASAYLLWWFVSRGLRVRCAEDAVLFLVLLIVGNHAMLELPLHHAYFLLPAGLVMGALDIRLGVRPRWPASLRATWASWSAWLFAAVLLALTIRDYARVEPSFQSLRFEWANVKTEPAKVPDVVLLTQWRDFVQFAKFDLAREVTDADLQWMQDQASLRPNTGFFQVLAMSLARRGQPELAAHWLRTMCTVVAKGACAAVRASWAYQAAHDPRLAAVPWPR